jgi:hypothetical protein
MNLNIRNRSRRAESRLRLPVPVEAKLVQSLVAREMNRQLEDHQLN